MEAQQNFIIEASRQTSVENNANLQQTNSAWTNRIEPTLFRKGDYVSVNTAIVNQKGASGANNIEFSDQYNDEVNNLQQNFTLLNVGFYLNNNNVNSIPLPYKYLKANSNRTNPEKKANFQGRGRIFYDTSPFIEVNGNQVVNNKYGMARWYQIFANDYNSLSDHTADSLASFSAMNPNITIDGKRYAKVANTYVGWNRPEDGGSLTPKVELMTENIPLHIEKGFKDASSVGNTLTRTLQSTQDPYSTTEVYALPKSTLATLAPNSIAQTQTNPRFNGYCMKTIGANLQPFKQGILSNTEGALGNSPLYNNLCVEEPYVWEYGSRLLSNTSTLRLQNNPNFQPDYIGLNPHVAIDYPVLLWSTYNGSEFDQGDLQDTANYDYYSPHYTEAVDADAGGENVTRWTGFTGVMSDFNDDYADMVDDIDGNRGVMLMKNGSNTYRFFVPQTADFVPEDPNDATKKLAFLSFIDNDSPSFDRILGYSAKNALESNAWEIKGDDITRWSNRFADDFFFSPVAAPGQGENHFGFDLDPNDNTKYVKGTIYVDNLNQSTNGSKNMWGLNPVIGFEEGKKYRIRFQSTLQNSTGGGTSSNYAGAYYIYYRSNGATPVFYQIDEDRNGSQFHEIVWTQGLATGARYDALFINIVNSVSFNEEIKLTEFQLIEDSLEGGDLYEIDDIFEPTSSTTTKLYKLNIKSGQLRNEKVNLENSTIFGGIFNHQYTAYSKLRAYKSGSDIIAFDGINANDYDDAVIMLYRNGGGNDVVIYNQYGSKVWRIAELDGNAPNEIVSGTTIGTILGGNETSLKNPFRSGQQYYDFSVGNSWTYERDTPDFNAGNTWGNTLGSPLQYTATNHQPPLTLNYDIYLKDNTYSGGTPSYTYSFQDTEGVTANGNEYDSIFTIDTNTGTTYTAYLLTDRVNGLSGIYEFNNTTAGNTWTITTTGGHSGFGYIQFAGAFGTLLSPTTAWVVNNIAFNYDWDFDATPAGYTQDYLLAIDPNNLKQGTYMYFGSSNFFVAYQSIGTYSYDDATRTITFYRRGTATTQNTLTTAVNPIPNLEYSTTFTMSIADPLPTISAGAPINETISYFAQLDAYRSTTGNLVTFYFAMNLAVTDNNLQGKTGRLIYEDGGTWYDKLWNWGGALVLDFDDPTIVLTATGGTPTLTNVIQYETKQDVTIDGITYALPKDGKQYGFSSLDLLGETTLTTDLHLPIPTNSDALYLGVDMGTFNTGFQSGLVYETLGEADTANAVANWRLAINTSGTCDLIFTQLNGDLAFTLEENQSNITRYGWVLLKTNKYNTGLSPNPTQTLTIQSGSGTETGDYYSNVRDYGRTGTNGRFLQDGSHTFPNDTGTSEYLEGQNLERFNSNMPKSTLLMTNIKCTQGNLEIIRDYFRYTEVYNGNIESSRKKIAEDINNFYARLDLGRTNDDKLQVDRTEAPYVPEPYNEDGKEIPSVPLFNFTMRQYGAMGVDDSDADVLTDYNGTKKKGSNKNDGCINPRMLTGSGHEQRIRVYTRWKDGFENRVTATNRFDNEMKEGEFWERESKLYGSSITTDEFKTNHTELYNFCVDNNVGIVPFLAKDWSDRNGDGTYNYVLCIGFETYDDIDRDNNLILKIQDGTFVGFSPSFLDHNYIMPMNLDMPYVAGVFSTPESPNQPSLGYQPSIRKQDNQNHINIGAAPTISYNPELNRFQWSYLHTPFKFNEITGADDDLEEEVGFLNSSTLMRMKQSIGENNLESGGEPEREDPSGNITPAVPPTSIHMGLADSQCGIFIHDIYGQTPSDTFIRHKDDGTLITADNYDNTLFFTLGFSYFDLKPIRFVDSSFNNRFNANTFNVISGDFKTLGTSPFTTNSGINVGDQIKTNIFTEAYLTRTYEPSSPYSEIPDPASTVGTVGNSLGGTPAFYLGYNNLLSVSIKTTSAEMTSRSVIVNLTAPFYRIYCNLPLDTLTYLANGSLSCAGYMTKNYQSQSFIYSFASDYGGYLTRDVLITDLRTEIRDPRGLLVNSIDSNSAVFYKITRQIALESGLTPKQEKEQAELLLERQQQEAEEATEIRNVSMDVIKYFKNLFTQSSGGGNNTTELTNLISEPSGVEEVYQQIAQDTQIETTQPYYAFTDAQLKDIYDKYPELKESAEKLPEILDKERDLRQRGIETKEPDRPTVPLLNFEYLEELTPQQAEERYTPRQHRLFVAMGQIIEDALNEAQTQSPSGMVDLVQLQDDIKGIQLSSEVVTRLVKDLGHINDRKELRRLVEHVAKQNDPNGNKAEQKKFATKVMRMLKVAQDRAMEIHPNLMGNNPFKITRKRRTKKEMAEARAMGREDPREIQRSRRAKERERMGREDVDAMESNIKRKMTPHDEFRREMIKSGKYKNEADFNRDKKSADYKKFTNLRVAYMKRDPMLGGMGRKYGGKEERRKIYESPKKKSGGAGKE